MPKKILRTDTATFAVFDRKAMQHRLESYCDWWSLPQDMIAEINAGNCVMFGTGADGGFEIDVELERTLRSPDFTALIKAPSGTVYIGAGEDMTGEGLEPKKRSVHYGGLFLEVPKGTLHVSVKRAKTKIRMGLTHVDGEAANAFQKPLLVE